MHAVESVGGRNRRRLTGLVAFAALAIVLAIPALASAHPQVYSLTPKKAPAGCTFESSSTGACLENNAVRYAVANDGYARTYTETTGSAPSGKGMINYQLIPKAFREWKVGETVHKMTAEDLLGFTPADTAVQPHAVCSQTVLDEPGTIAAWQGAEPFFDYVPWQKAGAGLGDDPAAWIALVQDELGVDLTALSTEAEFETACTGKGGTYYKADTGSNPAEEAVKDAVKAAKQPFEAQVAQLTGEKSALEKEIAAWKASNAALTGERTALQQQVDGLKKANTKKNKTITKLRKQVKAARNG